MDLTRLYPIALALAVGVALYSTARLWWSGFSRRRRLKRQARRAVEGERDAERLLARAGYDVVGRQVAAEVVYVVDGDPTTVAVRADLLVRRAGRSFVAEVKTGEIAPRVRTPATRRQLLEYAHAFDVDGVLLVEPEAARIRRVAVPVRRAAAPARIGSTLTALSVGAVLGALAAAWWLTGA